MKLSMSSIRHCARTARQLPDDLGFDPCKDMSFSWSGIKLFIDLKIDPKDLENVENVGQIWVADHTNLQDKDPEDDAAENPGSTQESSSLQSDAEAIMDHLLANHQMAERDCNNQLVGNHQNEERDCNIQPASGVEKSSGADAEPDTNCTHCSWPEWGDPLPPEDLDDDIDVDYAADGEQNPTLKKVTFSNVVTIVEPSSLQEDRETGSFSYAGSSDEELEQGTYQVTSISDGNSSDISPLRDSNSTEKESLNSADVSAACHLLELGNESNHGNSKAVAFESSGVSGQSKREFYDLSRDLERLSKLVEKIYAAVPEMSIVSNSQEIVSSEESGSWTIEVSKDSGRIRMKRIKREKEAESKGRVLAVDDDNEVLERPPRKRQYKSVNKLS